MNLHTNLDLTRKSLPKQRKPAEKVEIPVAAGRKSLPKQRKPAEKGRNPQFRRLTLPAHTPGPHCRPSPSARSSLPKQLKIAQSKFSCS